MAHENIMYERTITTFKQINPAKKYASFTYCDIEHFKEVIFYQQKGWIVKLAGKYYQFAGIGHFLTSDPKTKSRIEIKEARKVIYSIND